jgi:hypothetical protein
MRGQKISQKALRQRDICSTASIFSSIALKMITRHHSAVDILAHVVCVSIA